MKNSDASRLIGIRRSATGLAAAAVLGVAALAGCGSSASDGKAADSGGSTHSASSSVSSASSLSSSSGTGTGAGGGGGAGVTTTASSAASSTAKSGGKTPTSSAPSTGSGGSTDCTSAMLKITVAAVREPINHVLITATNTSQRRCRLNDYPALRLDPEQQAPTAPVPATKPAAPVVLAPGASAYAGLMTSAADGSGSHGKNEPTIELQLVTSDGGSDPNAAPVKLTMPKGSEFVDDSAVVTYWVTDQQTALS